jgi:hypothetical protein
MIKERDKEEVTPKTIQEIPKTQEMHKEEEWAQQNEKESLKEIKGKTEQEEKENRKPNLEWNWIKIVNKKNKYQI